MSDLGTSRFGSASQEASAHGLCAEKARLLKEFARACRELIELMDDQVKAVIHGDPDFMRFDTLVFMATEKKQRAKYAYMVHVDAHGCTDNL